MVQVGNAQIANDAVTSAKIADNALSLPGFQRASPIVNVPPNTIGEAIAFCNPRESLLAGGFQTAGAAANRIFVLANFVPAGPVGSQAEIFSEDDGTTAQLQSTAICIPPFP